MTRVADLAEHFNDATLDTWGDLESLTEMLTINRLRLPPKLRLSLACAKVIENIQGTIRRVTRHVKRWRDASMALRWQRPACWRPR